MATLTDLPFEMLSITAADSGLTNRDRKQARLACRKLADVMTPVIFRRAYISRIKTDRDAFLSLANTPHLAAHVKEIIWFELEIDWQLLDEESILRFEVQLSDGRNVNLFEAARDMFWLPVEPEFQRNPDDEIVHRRPPKCADEFLVHFKAAVARMPKLHTFASEQMDPHRIVSLVDGFPFEVGVLMKWQHGIRCQPEAWSDFLHIFLETIVEEKGRINKLHCGNEMSGSLVRIDPRYHAAMPYLISLKLSITNVIATIGGGDVDRWKARQNIVILWNVMSRATELRELSLSLDCNSEFLRWNHLRSLKLGAISATVKATLPLIKAHATTLRHLNLNQCRPSSSFVRELSQIDGLQLDSIIISDSEVSNSDLMSEEELLRFIRGGNVQDGELVKMIEEGNFVTHNRRPDILDYQAIKNSEADLDELSDDSSVGSSDAGSDSDSDLLDPEIDLDSETTVVSHGGWRPYDWNRILSRASTLWPPM